MRKYLAPATIAASLVLGAQTAAAAPNSATADATSSTAIIQPITIGKDSDLAFGRVVKPTSGTGTVTISKLSDTVSASGAVALSGVTTSRAKFTINGEGGQAVSITVPASLTMSNAANDNITVTLAPDLGTSASLSGSAGSTGAATLNVGGEFSLDAATPTGLYTGTFQVSVAYQ